MPVIDQPTPSIVFTTSVAVDLFWLLVDAGRAGRNGQTEAPGGHLSRLFGNRSLVKRVGEFWDEGPDDFSELLVLADHAGVLVGGDDRDIASSIARAAASVPLDPPLRSETPEAREVVWRRLSVLQTDRLVRRQYERLLSDAWSAASADRFERALPLEEEAVSRCTERLGRGASWHDLFDDTGHLDRWLNEAAQRAKGSLTVALSAYGRMLLLDLPSTQLIGLRVKENPAGAKREHSARLARRLRAVSDPTRLSLLRLLASESLGVSELAARLGVSQPTVSNHVKLLREAGLVADVRQDGRQRLVLERDVLAALLDDVKRHVEGSFS